MFQVNPYGIFGVLTVAMCWASVVVLYRVGATGSVARMLALLLLAEGATLVTAGYIELFMTPAAFESSWIPAFFEVNGAIHLLGDCAFIALYPPFLAAALHTKLTRPFAARRMRIGLAVASVALLFFVSFGPLEIGLVLLYGTLSLLFGYALVASIHAWHVAAPGIARTRAGIFALAFGLRDVCWGIVYADGIRRIVMGLMDAPESDWFYVVYAAGTFFAVPLIAYGILRTQLFDIDLRIRWTIKQSTLATVVVTLIFLLSEGADRFLSDELGNFAGLLAAAVVVFFLAPLQRFAERVASVAMPNTENTPEYAAHRKMQVYEAAVAEAVPDGKISERERALLNSLRGTLGISEADAAAIERDLVMSTVTGGGTR
jgi:hypothetical protein